MALFKGITNAKSASISPDIQKAEQKCREAENNVNGALLELGKKYYEASKDNSDSQFADLIAKISSCIDSEKLWKQYRLFLEGKMKCEKCGAIITSDSAFCNKCGTSITPLDFSSLRMNGSNTSVSDSVCPSCGASLVADAMFCEKCGHKIN